MGVSPLDLQTMYANMNNVAKVASHMQQGAVLAQQLQESKIIQQNAEKAAQVHKAADNEAKSTGINDEGHQGGTSYGNGKRKNQEQPEENQASSKKAGEIRESYLGIHIDITR